VYDNDDDKTANNTAGVLLSGISRATAADGVKTHGVDISTLSVHRTRFS